MGHSHSDNETNQLVGVAALAAGIGALVALLFSSRNGAETREAIRNKAEQFKTKAQDSKQDIKEAADDAKESASTAKRQAKDKLKDVTDDLDQ